MITVLFACVHNAGRSQMAAAWFNALADPLHARALSAGTAPGARVHPEVLAVMAEVGIDLSTAKPRLLTADMLAEATHLITLGCGESCPVVPPGIERADWPVEDPKGRPLERVREIRDELRRRVAGLVAAGAWGAPPLHCPSCFTLMEPRRENGYGFQACPHCGGQFWHKFEIDRAGREISAAIEKAQQRTVLVECAMNLSTLMKSAYNHAITKSPEEGKFLKLAGHGFWAQIVQDEEIDPKLLTCPAHGARYPGPAVSDINPLHHQAVLSICSHIELGLANIVRKSGNVEKIDVGSDLYRRALTETTL